MLIQHGELSGIVDVDEVCFGDRIAHLGLTRMALMAKGLPTDYIDYWCAGMRLNELERKALDFYTAEKCFCFLAEQSQPFNQDQPAPVDRAQIRLLERVLDELLQNGHLSS